MLKRLQDHRTIVYVAANLPHSSLVQMLNKEGVNTHKMFFIDCVSTSSEPHEDNVFVATSPLNLTSTAIAITESLKQIKGKKILFFDSLNAFVFTGNEPLLIRRFSNFLISRAEAFGADQVIFTLTDPKGDVRTQLEYIVNEVKRYGA